MLRTVVSIANGKLNLLVIFLNNDEIIGEWAFPKLMKMQYIIITKILYDSIMHGNFETIQEN
jgi:hypothetical protein